MIQDLRLIERTESLDRDGRYSSDRVARLEEALDHFAELKRDERELRRLSDAAFDLLLRHSRRQAQELLLGSAGPTLSDLAKMYNASGEAWGIDIASLWEQVFASTPFRISLSELPQVAGSSTLWKQEIETKLRAFRAEFGWVIDPLVVPVALEVVIKPPPPSRQHGLHDLDNVLRKYLIPGVMAILKPVSQGVSRYEAWRLPPAAEGSQGFVSVAVVADITGLGGVRQIDENIETWRAWAERQ